MAADILPIQSANYVLYVCMQVPKDWMLFLGVLVLVGVCAITLIGALLFDDYKAIEVEDNETGTERDVS